MRRLEKERGREKGAESREGGEGESKNEVYDSVRKTDNKSISWGRSAEAEMLIDRGATQSQLCLPAEDT